MKKNLAIAVAAAVTLMSLAGCQGGSQTAQPTQAAGGTTTAAGDTTTAAGADSSQDSGDYDPNGAIAKIKAAGKLTMGTAPDFAPWEFKDVSSGTTEYVGSDIELGKYIAQQLGVELEIKPMEFSAIQQALASGNIDIGISGFAYTEKRAEALGLSERYNVNAAAGQGLLVLKDQAADYDSAESFAGKKIAAQNASLQHTLVQEQLPKDVQVQIVTQVTDGVMMLTTGKVDAVAVSGDNGESLVKTYPDLAMAEFKFAYDSDGNVVAVKKGNDELLTAINEIIAEVNETGLYEEWKTQAKALADSLGIETH
ncbi:MAG: transporter substrate-binding domain-containing protein [Hungatella sp.]|nr:transporter substrate-binding domain-containing protein [Hungatella sp.]